MIDEKDIPRIVTGLMVAATLAAWSSVAFVAAMSYQFNVEARLRGFDLDALSEINRVEWLVVALSAAVALFASASLWRHVAKRRRGDLPPTSA